jgi:hypothetical protein
MYIDYFRNIYAKNVEVADKESNLHYKMISMGKRKWNSYFYQVGWVQGSSG